LRHSCLTEIARTTKGDKWFVKEVAGHSDVKVSEGYIHLAQGYDARIEGMMG
jgi:integrase